MRQITLTLGEGVGDAMVPLLDGADILAVEESEELAVILVARKGVDTAHADAAMVVRHGIEFQYLLAALLTEFGGAAMVQTDIGGN